MWPLKYLYWLILFDALVTSFSSNTPKSPVTGETSARIILKHNIPDEMAGRIVSIYSNSSQPMAYQFVKENSDNSTFFLVSFDHPQNLTMKFHYINKRNIVKREMRLLVTGSFKDYRFRFEVQFKQLTISEFMEKERKILDYFIAFLNNQFIKVVSVELVRYGNLKVVIGSDSRFTEKSSILMNASCRYDRGLTSQYRINSTANFIRSFYYQYGLVLEECAMKRYEIDESNFYRISNQINFFVMVNGCHALNHTNILTTILLFVFYLIHSKYLVKL